MLPQAQTGTFPAIHFIDAGDFLERWRKARVSCFPEMVEGIESSADLDETKALRTIEDAGLRELLLKRVFEQSKKLGESAKWYFGIEWEAKDFWTMLSFEESLAQVPQCFKGTWKNRATGVLLLKRKTCALANGCGTFICNYYREALDGLVTGLAGDTAFVRTHSGPTNSENQCVDVFCEQTASKKFHYAPVTEELTAAHAQAQKTLEPTEVALDFLGVREGALHYTWETGKNSGCSDRSFLVSLAIEEALKKQGQKIEISDMSPRAVIGPGTSM